MIVDTFASFKVINAKPFWQSWGILMISRTNLQTTFTILGKGAERSIAVISKSATLPKIVDKRNTRVLSDISIERGRLFHMFP